MRKQNMLLWYVVPTFLQNCTNKSNFPSAQRNLVAFIRGVDTVDITSSTDFHAVCGGSILPVFVLGCELTFA